MLPRRRAIECRDDPRDFRSISITVNVNVNVTATVNVKVTVNAPPLSMSLSVLQSTSLLMSLSTYLSLPTSLLGVIGSYLSQNYWDGSSRTDSQERTKRTERRL